MTTENWRRFIRDFLIRGLGFRLLVKPQVSGLANIPATAPTILMMNHAIAIDGVIVMGVVTHRWVIPLLKAETFETGWRHLATRWGALSVQRGELDRAALKTMTALLGQGQLLLIAPEGTRGTTLRHPKDGLVYLALKTNPVIVPTAIYNGESWVHDLLLPRRTPIRVDFGKPFRLVTSEGRASREVMQQMSREMMYQLAALLPERYRGVYADLSQASSRYLNFDLSGE